MTVAIVVAAILVVFRIDHHVAGGGHDPTNGTVNGLVGSIGVFGQARFNGKGRDNAAGKKYDHNIVKKG